MIDLLEGLVLLVVVLVALVVERLERRRRVRDEIDRMLAAAFRRHGGVDPKRTTRAEAQPNRRKDRS